MDIWTVKEFANCLTLDVGTGRASPVVCDCIETDVSLTKLVLIPAMWPERGQEEGQVH